MGGTGARSALGIFGVFLLKILQNTRNLSMINQSLAEYDSILPGVAPSEVRNDQGPVIRCFGFVMFRVSVPVAASTTSPGEANPTEGITFSRDSRKG